MPQANVDTGERVVDVRDIGPSSRHTVIIQFFEHFDGRRSLQLIPWLATACAFDSKINTASASDERIRNKASATGVFESDLARQKERL